MKLDTVVFSIGPSNEFYDNSVDIHINGVNLLDMVRNYENTGAHGDDRDIVGAQPNARGLNRCLSDCHASCWLCDRIHDGTQCGANPHDKVIRVR
tara:strand:- start:8621 stop:8905 length:285 start_codon:yes stop_codon:yes gene_type:complete